MNIPNWLLWLLFPILALGGFLSGIYSVTEFAQDYIRIRWFPWYAQLWFAASVLAMLLGIACLGWAVWRLIAGGGA